MAPESPSYAGVHENNPLFHQQTGLYDLYASPPSPIVMLGDSITQAADWHELLGRTDIVNRGIASDTTFGFIARLPQILHLHPVCCCVMGGINDLYENAPPTAVAENLRLIGQTLRDCGSRVIVQSTLHVSPLWTRSTEKNREVVEVNRLLREWTHDENFELLDLNTKLAAGQTLRPEFTYDGVHLTAPAYQIWKDELIPFLSRAGL